MTSTPTDLAPRARDLATAPGGGLRPGWDRVLPALFTLGPDELARRQRAADQAMRAGGAGVVLHDDAEGTLRPWGIDIVPFVVDWATWSTLAEGLAERARLLAAVLDDLHGPRELLRAGVVPIEAVAAHAPALWSWWQPFGGGRLPLVVGADVVLGPDGSPCVVADHTDVATGEGQAMLARAVTARVLPRPEVAIDVSAHEVLSHESYLRALRAELAAAAPEGRAGPRTVVVTGPPDAPGYVENAQVATRLGYHLAETADIVVHGGRVWLRSLEGPEPVDVLARRVPEALFDPVEDRRVRGPGVAGVVEAVRGGRVTVVNPYGTGVVSSMALAPFLDAAARHLWGTGPKLPTAPTFWCGDPEHRRTVTASPDDYVLFDTDRVAGEAPVVGSELGDAEVARWLERIEAHPHRIVAQRVVQPGAAPAVTDAGALTSAPLWLRTQVLLGAEGATVFPGGHARLAAGAATPFASRQRGVGKDVWVLDDHPRDQVRLRSAPNIPQVDLHRSLPARAAESLYWSGRSAERAEMAARTVLVALQRLAGADIDDADDADVAAICRTVRAASGGIDDPDDPLFRATPAELEAQVRDALTGRPGSVVDSLRLTVQNARSARQLLSGRTWRLLAMIDSEAAALDDLACGGGTPGLPTFDAAEALDRVLVPLAALAGLANESVVRGPGWRFLDIGRRLERALLVLGTIEAMFGDGAGEPVSPVRGDVTLAACESLVAYRRSYRSDVTLDALGHLLLADRDNPRSIAFQLDQLAVDLLDLPDRAARRDQLAAVRTAARALDARLPLGSGQGRDGLDPAVELVVDVRGPLLRLGEMVPAGWFGERPRRLR